MNPHFIGFTARRPADGWWRSHCADCSWVGTWQPVRLDAESELDDHRLHISAIGYGPPK